MNKHRDNDDDKKTAYIHVHLNAWLAKDFHVYDVIVLLVCAWVLFLQELSISVILKIFFF